ncbi:MAG: hypothetical protein FJ385_07680 [Verrucomicrobia bacterium]|nr:hypothetical protein [Verrucomicrobiota bacterium]
MASKKTTRKQTATPSARAKAPAKTKTPPAAAKSRKPVTASKPRATTARKKAATPKSESKPKASREAVAHAAYLNYRRRIEKGLPGDPHGDWLEAERQLGLGK